VVRGWRSRLWATLGLFAGGCAGIVVYLALWAGRFAWYQNLLVVITIALAVPCAVVWMWFAWVSKVRRRSRQWFVETFETEGHGSGSGR
jgi:hypothetical protein